MASTPISKMPQQQQQQQPMYPQQQQQQQPMYPQPQQQLMVPAPQPQQQLMTPQPQQQLIAPAPQQQLLMPQQPQQQQLMVPQQQRQPQVRFSDMMQAPAALLPPPPVYAPKMQPQRMVRGERHMFTTSDDNVMMKQIHATHAYDGRQVEVRPLLQLIEEILQRSTTTTLDRAVQAPLVSSHMESLDERSHQDAFVGMLEALAYTIHKISCEISCKCSGGGDAHSTTVALFSTLSSFSWDAKVVLALAAFAVNYGEFWLVAELYGTHPLAKSIALLKQLPDVFEQSNLLRPKFEALRDLIKAMLDVTKCIVQFNELPSQYISADQPLMSVAATHIPTAVYWTIRSVVACASQIIGLIGLGHEYIPSTSEAWELSSLAHKMKNIHEHLTKQLALCYQYIDEKKHVEAFNTLIRLFETIHIDNHKILKALIYAKDDMQPLLEGSTKRRVGVEVLRRKNVLLLISDLDISQEELSIMEQMYKESREQPSRPESQYEVVWLPIVDRTLPWTDAKQRDFDRLQVNMPWYSVHHPSLIDPAVVKYIKEMWNFNKKPILVVLDIQGRVVNPNALHMLWIWGSLAFPFTSMREEALWREETWRLELLVDGIDPHIFNWIVEERFICLYGGEDIDWIKKFTTTARAVAQAARIPLEMVYVGKSNPKDRVKRNINIITTEKLSHCWPDLTSIWFFWIRLESMWHSKMQHGKTIDNDRIMQGIMTMLTFDGSEQGWALISKGSANMVKAKGEMMLNCFQKYDAWKENVDSKGFIQALDDHLQQLHTPHHCSRLILPGSVGRIPEVVVCTECGRPMEKFLMYSCCTD
ncbi:protein SIEVE ELEMENT OCCLUSION B-like [Telopea speciosissima]|uniref:protein SIEVE ELEMENT OCCLUSION B-like n=1 Tax=Telopea speciosissima TaxID=54955 RepID=UPI001CC48635|nr:protein SIEVE ELEMENT OCCLUSION B-like [Telopea speciosissima]